MNRNEARTLSQVPENEELQSQNRDSDIENVGQEPRVHFFRSPEIETLESRSESGQLAPNQHRKYSNIIGFTTILSSIVGVITGLGSYHSAHAEDSRLNQTNTNPTDDRIVGSASIAFVASLASCVGIIVLYNKCLANLNNRNSPENSQEMSGIRVAGELVFGLNQSNSSDQNNPLNQNNRSWSQSIFGGVEIGRDEEGRRTSSRSGSRLFGVACVETQLPQASQESSVENGNDSANRIVSSQPMPMYFDTNTLALSMREILGSSLSPTPSQSPERSQVPSPERSQVPSPTLELINLSDTMDGGRGRR